MTTGAVIFGSLVLLVLATAWYLRSDPRRSDVGRRPTEDGRRTLKVSPGETPQSVAARTPGVDVYELLRWNDLEMNPDEPFEGEVTLYVEPTDESHADSE